MFTYPLKNMPWSLPQSYVLLPKMRVCFEVCLIIMITNIILVAFVL